MKLLPSLSILCFLILFSGQSDAQLKKGYKLLKKGNYIDAIEAFEADIFNKKANIAVEAEYNLSKIFFDKNFEDYNLEKAYGYAKSALNRQLKLKGKELKKAQKSGLGKLYLENFKRRIVNEAYNVAITEDSYTAYQHFLDEFDGPTPIQFEKVTIWRNKRGLEEVKKKDTYRGYENFRNRYFESLQSYTPETDSLLQMLLFESFMNENGWGQYGKFASKYPDNVYVKDSAAAANFRPIATSKRSSDFKDFIIGFPNSVFADLAVRKIYKLTMHNERLGDYDYFLRTYPNFKDIDALWERYLELYIKREGEGALERFKQNYPQAPKHILKKVK
jgi:hypothetical protein